MEIKKHKSAHSKTPKKIRIPVIMLYIYIISKADIYTLYQDGILTLHIVYVADHSMMYT